MVTDGSVTSFQFRVIFRFLLPVVKLHSDSPDSPFVCSETETVSPSAVVTVNPVRRKGLAPDAGFLVTA